MIYTSYFSRLADVPNPISISLFRPKWLKKIEECEKLMPPIWLLNSYKNGKTSWACYDQIYRRVVLAKLDPAELVKELTPLGSSQDFTLLCYEAPDKFCHRQIVAEWLREAGFPCEEFNFGQATLF